MIKNSKYLTKLFLALSFVLSSQIAFAQGVSGDADIEPDEEELPSPPKPGGPSGVNNDADREPDTPVDMHTSALLVAGIGLIASYTYFAKRRKENI